MGNGTPFLNCLLSLALLLERNGEGNCLIYQRCRGILTDIVDGLPRFFRVFGNNFSVQAPKDLIGFFAVLFNLIDVVFSNFRKLGNDLNAVFRLGLDLPKSCEAHVADHDSDDAEECKNNGDHTEAGLTTAYSLDNCQVNPITEHTLELL